MEEPKEFDRQLPQDLDAERAVIGSLMLAGNDFALFDLTRAGLRAESFFQSDHGIYFEALCRMRGAEKAVDPVTIRAELVRSGMYDEVGGMEYHGTLMHSVPSAANGPHYASLVREKYVLREVIRSANAAIRRAYAPTHFDRAIDIASDFLRDLTAIACTGTADRIHKLSDVIAEIMGAQDEGVASRLSTGLRELDELIGGLPKGKFTLIGGRPGMGKSLLCKQLVLNVARAGVPCGIVTIEEDRQKIGQNYLANVSGIENNRIVYGTASEQEWAEIVQAIPRLNCSIHIADEPVQLPDVEAAIIAMATQHKCELVVVDYLQLVDVQAETENREITKISKTLKSCFKRLGIVGVAACQLNRGNEVHGVRRPTLRDLRGSGCLAGDSKVWMAEGGMVPIHELAGRSGFSVWSLSLDTLKLEKATVTRAICTGRKPVYQLTTQLGRRLRATADHPLYTMDGWRGMCDLVDGQRIAIPRRMPFEPVEFPCNDFMPIAQAALMGLLIGDGCTLPDHVTQYTTNEYDLAENAVALAECAFPGGTRPRIVRERNWYQVYFPSTVKRTHGVRNPISAWLDSHGIWGLRSHEKRVPCSVFSQPDNVVTAFLSHLWATDGSVGKLVSYYASSSRELCEGVQSLLLRFGINARLSCVSQGDKGRDQYHVTISGADDLIRFCRHVGIAGQRKSRMLRDRSVVAAAIKANTNRDVIPASAWRGVVRQEMAAAGLTLREFHRRNGTQHGGAQYKRGVSRARMSQAAAVIQSAKLTSLATSDVYWDQVRSIEKISHSEEVFDLTVPTHANFIADGVIVHNSLEQDGDLILLLHRPDYYEEDPARKSGQLQAIVAKNKDGATGVVPLRFSGKTQTVSDWNQRQTAQSQQFEPWEQEGD